MAKIAYRKIKVGNSHIELPYCNRCGKAVYDQDQVYCCWCGSKFVKQAAK
ncbi:hypothetical protein [Indiicoccus explosivorum]|nr:hypothetical protein [Indiicoccus explosivorum]